MTESITYRCPKCDGETMEIHIIPDMEIRAIMFWCVGCKSSELGIQLDKKKIEGLIRHQLGEKLT